ncbi:3-hydroxyacyl-CoA dehydrogenase NAD-binding domain-containing protein [Microvirga sp. 2YAF29]|uniref:3-hydroxyacyl-CoA dehydrogenase NAD-binding domain-containing protein n=1 Tax=Microvirga sp. 2YAF29 TaxID=3233031 RepID=UPI003F9B344A
MSVVQTERVDGISILWINNPPVNALNTQVRTELVQAVEAANADPSILGIVLASRILNFVAGADIKEFGRPPVSPTLRDVIDIFDASQKPLVAAINGVAFGGGLEIALACDARIVTPTARLGLPEVKLGLIPGAGGTQRLPRLIDAAEALKMMADGAPKTGDQSLALGLADEITESDRLIDAAISKCQALARQGQRRLLRDAKVGEAGIEAFDKAAAELKKARHDEPQIEALIDSVRSGYGGTFTDGLKREREHFEQLMASERSQALRYAFFAERQSGQLPEGVDSSKALNVKSVGVIGGGTMGTGIAMAFASSGVHVTIIETDADAANRAVERIAGNYEQSLKRGRISEATRAEIMGRIKSAVSYDALADADLVIEAAFEEMDIKRQIFEALAVATKPQAILATNTSYLDVDKIAESSGHPERVVGMHFFSPANVMRLVEVVRGTQSSPEAIATVVKAARRLGKVPVIVGNCHGFVGNRMLARRSEQVDRLLLEGASPEDVDAVLTEFGFKLGPCAMGDLAGLDISWRMRRATGKTAPVADALVEAGRLGQKSGRGYYVYADNGRTKNSDPAVRELIESVAGAHGVKRREISKDEILDRLILPMVNEGARIIEEGIADRPSDIDVIWLNGYGFPNWRGGPMFYAQQRGLAEVASRLEALSKSTGDTTLAPAPLLQKLAAEGEGATWGSQERKAV